MRPKTFKIFIRDLKINALIGIYESEKNTPQELRIHLTAEYAPSDQTQFVCYKSLCDFIRRFSDHNHIDLVEEFAERIATHTLNFPEVKNVWIKVEKTQAIPEAAGVGVEIYREK